ncbi:Pro-kumamolisin, activation domain-containing protein [Dichomitus squalens]|nr:Pro-kumamolisin, activation domain-containing protein [Dichomitus squalens]
MVAAALLFLSLLSSAMSRPNPPSTSTHRAIARGGTRVILPPFLSMFIALPPSNITGLQQSLLDISDPTSPNYGSHLSKDVAESFAAPAPETVQAVNAWLAQHNVTSQTISPSGDMLRIVVHVDTANSLINANYTLSLDPGTNSTVYTTSSYSIPAELQPHIAFVYPTTK